MKNKGVLKNQGKSVLALLVALSVIGAVSGCTASEPAGESAPVNSSENSAAENKTDDVAEAENTETEETPAESEATEAAEQQAVEVEEKVLYEDSTAKITLKGFENSLFGTELKVQIENLSDKSICVQARNVSINGVMVEPTFSSDIAAGKTANDSVTFYNLAQNRIDTVGNIELSFHVFDSESYDSIVDTEQISVVIDDSISNHTNSEGTVVYEAEGVKISYIGKIKDDYSKGFEFVAENTSDKAVTVQARELSVDDVMFDPVFSRDLMPGKIDYGTMTFYDENFPEEPKSAELKFHIFDTETMDAVSDSDVVTIDTSK